MLDAHRDHRDPAGARTAVLVTIYHMHLDAAGMAGVVDDCTLRVEGKCQGHAVELSLRPPQMLPQLPTQASAQQELWEIQSSTDLTGFMER